MITIHWFFLKLKSRSYKGYAGCCFIRVYKANLSCGNTISDLCYPCKQKVILSGLPE